MNEQRAREILGATVKSDNRLYDPVYYIFWGGESSATIDCQLSAEDLEAIAWWMRNMTVRRTA